MKVIRGTGPRRRGHATVVLAMGVLIAFSAGACASDGGDDNGASGDDTTSTDSPDTTDSSDSSTTTAVPRPEGPAATIAGPMTGGNGIFIGAATPAGPALEAAGYVEEEFTASGTATSYTSEGELPADGTYDLAPA